MERQETLDRAFGVTPEERAVLRQGEIPRSLLERLRQTSGAPRANWMGFLVIRVDNLDRAVAIELGAETTFVEREPRRPPPEEPLRVDVPAD